MRLAPAALATWLVAWQGRLLPPRLLLALGLGLGALALLLLASRRGGRVLVLAAVCGCAASSAVVTSFHTDALTDVPIHALAAREAAVRVEAVLTADPRRALTSGPGGRDPAGVGRECLRIGVAWVLTWVSTVKSWASTRGRAPRSQPRRQK